ncbi:myb-like protein M [Acipenser ruthenus]|uniref:myb-like protein M n=1 Tax=Acipenser ruthenus TaxID=7906 RepID=UPI0027412523|nr:myb-like protein M [Acipenser ruthenus]
MEKSLPPASPSRQPISSAILLRLISSFHRGCFTPFNDFVNEALCLVAFFGFLRCSKFSVPSISSFPPIGLRHSDLTQVPRNHFVLSIKTSKTDQLHQDFSVIYVQLCSLFPIYTMWFCREPGVLLLGGKRVSLPPTDRVGLLPMSLPSPTVPRRSQRMLPDPSFGNLSSLSCSSNHSPYYSSNCGVNYCSNCGLNYSSNHSPNYSSNHSHNHSPYYSSNRGPNYSSNHSPYYSNNHSPYYSNNHSHYYSSNCGLNYSSNHSSYYSSNHGPNYSSKRDPNYSSNCTPYYSNNRGPNYSSKCGPNYSSNHSHYCNSNRGPCYSRNWKTSSNSSQYNHPKALSWVRCCHHCHVRFSHLGCPTNYDSGPEDKNVFKAGTGLLSGVPPL